MNMRDYIKKNNPSADTISIEFKTLTTFLPTSFLITEAAFRQLIIIIMLNISITAG